MAVEAVARKPVRVVFQNNRGAVIAVVDIIGEAMHDAINGRENGRTGSGPKIDAEVDRAGFVGVGREMATVAIQRPVFIVATNAYYRPGVAQRIEDVPIERTDVGQIKSCQIGVIGRKIERQVRRGEGKEMEHGGKGRGGFKFQVRC